MKVTWDRYFHVCFIGTRPEPDEQDDEPSDEYDPLAIDTSNSLSVSEIEIGTKPDGGKCWREYSPHGGHRSRDGEPDIGMVTDRWRKGEVSCILPATEPNRVALESINEALLALHERLFEFFEPDEVDMHLNRSLGELLASVSGKSPAETR